MYFLPPHMHYQYMVHLSDAFVIIDEPMSNIFLKESFYCLSCVLPWLKTVKIKTCLNLVIVNEFQDWFLSCAILPARVDWKFFQPSCTIKTPEITVSIIKELSRRGVLANALAGRDEKEISRVLNFLIRYVLCLWNTYICIWNPLSPNERHLLLA